MDSKVQCIVFNKSVFNVGEAVKWCSENGFKTSKIFESDFDIRVRQISPSYARSCGYSHFGSKQIETGVSFLIVLRDEATTKALVEYANINFEKVLKPTEQLNM